MPSFCLTKLRNIGLLNNNLTHVLKRDIMAIGAELEKKLSKIYESTSTLSLTFKGNDITIVTNDEGEATVLFIGKRNANGSISGERYVRKIVKDEKGKIVKSHWDNKGKVNSY